MIKKKIIKSKSFHFSGEFLDVCEDIFIQGDFIAPNCDLEIGGKFEVTGNVILKEFTGASKIKVGGDLTITGDADFFTRDISILGKSKFKAV